GAFPEQDQPFQARLFDSSNEAFRMRIQIRCPWWQFYGFHTAGLQDLQKLPREQRVAVVDQVSFAHQEAVRGITEVTCHLAHPKPIRLPGYARNLHLPTRQVDQEEHKESRQTLARPSLNREKVRRHDQLPMPGQKLFPGGLPLPLGRWFQTVLLQNVGNS